MKKKIMVFSGAGLSKESGVETFRDSDGLWNNYKIEDVATLSGWKKDKELVLDFYNQRRKQLKEVEPNDAHKFIAKLEEHFEVINITQNVDNLLERAGSTNVVHLHGELSKIRSTMDPNLIYDCDYDINIGDKCEKGSQLRPHIVWFGEMLNQKHLELSFDAADECDICIVIGTSMQVSPANEIPFRTKDDAIIYYIDPGSKDFYVPEFREIFFRHIQKNATSGMEDVYNLLTNN